MTDKTRETVFTSADFYLPSYDAGETEKWEKWSAIACDQHTSNLKYWTDAEEFTKGSPSTLKLFLPEAYLGTNLENAKKESAKEEGKKLGENTLTKYENSFVYIERTLVSGKIRRGLFGMVDLEKYDYEKGSKPDIRPTEATVTSRIPPRVEIRRNAVWETSHVMLFTECDGVFRYADGEKNSMKTLYDFDLMQGGGHITGRLVSGEFADKALEIIGAYEKAGKESGKMLYGVGDGNHSLASAKSLYEEKKSTLSGDALLNYRYASVELVSINDDAIVFEPIYRLLTGVDTDSFFMRFAEKARGGNAPVRVITGKSEAVVNIPVGDGGLICGALQDIIDEYLENHSGECDYVHEKETLYEAVEKNDSAVAFIFDGMKKSDLFPFVEANGVLPRKTFSMGDASEKRYYTELRLLSKDI